MGGLFRYIIALLVVTLGTLALFIYLKEHDPWLITMFVDGPVPKNADPLAYLQPDDPVRAMKMTTVIGALLIVSLLLAFIWAVLLNFSRWPKQAAARRNQKKHNVAHVTLRQGLIEMSEGRWSSAEKSLTKHAKRSDIPLLHYLSAARAAQLLGEPERRDEHLRAAYKANPDAQVAVSLTQAELQIAHGQLDQALATLNALQESSPGHPHVQKLLVRLYQALGDHNGLRRLLPEVQKHRIFSAEEQRNFANHVLARCLEDAGRVGDAESVEALWREASKDQREDTDLLLAYCRASNETGAPERAADHIRAHFRKNFAEPMALLFAELKLEDTNKQLVDLQTWQKQHGEHPALLLATARVARRQELWGKAKSMLESAKALAPRKDVLVEYATLLDQLGESDQAMAAYRQAVKLN